MSPTSRRHRSDGRGAIAGKGPGPPSTEGPELFTRHTWTPEAEAKAAVRINARKYQRHRRRRSSKTPKGSATWANSIARVGSSLPPGTRGRRRRRKLAHRLGHPGRDGAWFCRRRDSNDWHRLHAVRHGARDQGRRSALLSRFMHVVRGSQLQANRIIATIPPPLLLPHGRQKNGVGAKIFAEA